MNEQNRRVPGWVVVATLATVIVAAWLVVVSGVLGHLFDPQ